MSSKNKLQELLQKRGRKLPIYSNTKEGRPHEFRFRATVTLDNGLVFESPGFFSTIKQAENAAADFAVDAIRNPNRQPIQTVAAADVALRNPNPQPIQTVAAADVALNPQPIQTVDVALRNPNPQPIQTDVAVDNFRNPNRQPIQIVDVSVDALRNPNLQPIQTVADVAVEALRNPNRQPIQTVAHVAVDDLRNPNRQPIQTVVQNHPYDLPSDSQKDANKLKKEDSITIVKVDRKVDKLENGLATSTSSMEISPAESELKDEISQMSQGSAQSLCSSKIDLLASSRIQIVSLEAVPTSPNLGKATNKQMMNNIDSISEISGNKGNKEQGHNMTAYEPEKRHQDMEFIQQSEGRISTSLFVPGVQKNQLQEFAVRSGYDIPCYSYIREGPPHAPRFKATVIFNGKAFRAPAFCSSLRQAEHAAAAEALNSLSEEMFSMDESSVCKNLLQEKAQKEGSPLPEYDTTISGQLHMPIFTCTVKFDGLTFEGKAAKTKKQAEKNAALVAWTALKEGRRSTISTVQMLDKEKPLFCDPNGSPNVQVNHDVNEEKLKQSHSQLFNLDKSTDLSAVSHSEPQVFNTDSVKEPVQNMMNVLQNMCNDKVEQPGKKSFHTKYARGSKIRVMPALEPIKWPLSANAVSSSGRPWVAVILDDSMVQSQNNTS